VFGAVALASLIQILLYPMWGFRFPLIPFYPAVVLASWIGGFGPGVLATLLSAATADYFFIPPIHSFHILSLDDIVAVALFVGVGLLITGLNASLRRFAERERLARAEAEAANRAKDEFIANVSHELRTPLTSALAWTRMLRSGFVEQSKFVQAVDVIDRSLKTQTQLVEELLDASRIITGKMAIAPRWVEPHAIVRAAVESVWPDAHAKNIEVDVRGTAGENIFADPQRLQQVVWNLLTNAIKFTGGRGRIEIEYGVVARTFQLRVTDTGEGIAPAFLPFIFDRYQQADAGAVRKHKGGLGLGLHIVRSIVELHRGTVEVRSEGIGHGATFTVRLPMPNDHQPPDRS
jgi:signal transduction histidine kinase